MSFSCNIDMQAHVLYAHAHYHTFAQKYTLKAHAAEKGLMGTLCIIFQHFKAIKSMKICLREDIVPLAKIR